MSRWRHPPYDAHGGEGVALLVCVVVLAGGFGVLVWFLDRSGR